MWHVAVITEQRQLSSSFLQQAWPNSPSNVTWSCVLNVLFPSEQFEIEAIVTYVCSFCTLHKGKRMELSLLRKDRMSAPVMAPANTGLCTNSFRAVFTEHSSCFWLYSSCDGPVVSPCTHDSTPANTRSAKSNRPVLQCRSNRTEPFVSWNTNLIALVDVWGMLGLDPPPETFRRPPEVQTLRCGPRTQPGINRGKWLGPDWFVRGIVFLVEDTTLIPSFVKLFVVTCRNSLPISCIFLLSACLLLWKVE